MKQKRSPLRIAGLVCYAIGGISLVVFFVAGLKYSVGEAATMAMGNPFTLGGLGLGVLLSFLGRDKNKASG